MIIDCFTFFNELDLLEIRLNELYPVVDKFVLVEAELTQSLKNKPLYFNLHKNRYEKFSDKIVHIIMQENECPTNIDNIWSMENAQRNKIKEGVHKCNANIDDIILISDLDEIPKANLIEKIPRLFKQENINICSFEMEFFAYFINLQASSRKWIGTVACSNELFQQYLPQDFRNKKDFLPLIQDGGWHFSWLGGYEKVYEKSLSCIEPFDKNQLPSKEDFKKYFQSFINNQNKFFIHLENLSKQETHFTKVEINNTFPNFLLKNINNYNKFII